MDGIRFDRLNSIYELYNLISDIIVSLKHKTVDFMPYNVPRAFGEHWTGRCFRMKKKGSETIIWPIFGISYTEEPPVISISFDKNWCEPVFEKYKARHGKASAFVVQRKDKEIIFELAPSVFKEFSEAGLKRQREILIDFMKAVTEETAVCL